MGGVAELLTRFKLEAYTNAFEEAGYDDTSLLLTLDEDE